MSIALSAFGPMDIDNPATAMVYVDKQSQFELGLRHRTYTFPEVCPQDYITGEESCTDPTLPTTLIRAGVRIGSERLTPKFLREYGNFTFFLNIRTPPGLSTYPILDPNYPQAYSLQVEENIMNLQLGIAIPLPAGFSVGVGGHQVAEFDMPIHAGNVGVVGQLYTNPSYGQTFNGDVTVAVQTGNIPFMSVFTLLPAYGFMWDVGKALPALQGLKIGAMYRARHEIPFDMSLQIDQLEIDVDAQGETIHEVIEIDEEDGNIEFPTLHMVYIPKNTAFSLGWEADAWRVEGSARKKNYSEMIFGYFGMPEDLEGVVIYEENDDGDAVEVVVNINLGFEPDFTDYLELRDVYEIMFNGAARLTQWGGNAPLWLEGNFYYRPSYIVSQEKSYILDPTITMAGLALIQSFSYGDGYGVDIRAGFNAGRLNLTTAGNPGTYRQETPYGKVFGAYGAVAYRF